MNCPECGAKNAGCQARFDEFLALEFTDAAFGAVHHLTVAAFMLQHSSRLTREGWLHERRLLKEFLIENKPPALLRAENRDAVDSGKRTFKIKSVEGRPVLSKTSWRTTIMDVQPGNADAYCQSITGWAKAVLEESNAITL